MIERHGGNLRLTDDSVPDATRALHERGFTLIENAFDTEAVDALRGDIERVFEELPADRRIKRRSQASMEMFRYEMLNRSAICQQAVANPAILSVIEPLLAEDCHVIANTAWRNPAVQEGQQGGQPWHIDAGPHIPRPPGTVWPEAIPYPVFAIGVHIFLSDQSLADGPTGAIPGSHRSGQLPPREHVMDALLEYEGERCVPVVGRAGDVSFFVSDVWHRRMPTLAGAAGRFFLQVHYGRRDIAQRLRTTETSNSLSHDAIERAVTPRQRTVIGLHRPYYYDG